MISVDNISVEFAAQPLFGGVSYVVNQRDRIALVGKNGAGKSTMLKILAGLQEPTAGAVSRQGGCTVGYLPQVMNLNDGLTVREEARRTGDWGERASDEEDYNAQARREGMLARTLMGRGVRQEDFDRPTAEFSGGWRMRIELAKLLLMEPEVLLLDEPTNHLDIESIEWLEQFLVSRSGAVVLVSHDRRFVNTVTNRTLEISCGRVYDYRVPYDQYLTLRQERREAQLRAYANQQKEIADARAFIERFRYQATKAVQVQQKVRQLEKIVPVEVDEVDNSALHLRFTCSQRSGDFPVMCDELRKAYDHVVFEGVGLQLRRGEKVAFVGRNGEGKSTLVKCIMGEIPYEGELRIGHNVEIGYFAQNQAQLLDGDLTVYDTIDRVARGDIRLKIRDILGAFMFGGEASDKKVKVLSGGERTRLAMIKLLLEPVNFLILDEPTNHLDMKSKDVLKEAIRSFDGTVIVVSHDRDFLDGLVSRIYEFGGGKVREHLGGIAEWESGRLGEQAMKKTPAKTAEAEPAAGLSYKEQKAQKAKRQKAERAVKDAEQAVAELEQAVRILEDRLTTDPSLYEKYAAMQKQLARAEDEWAQAMEDYEALQ